jgi:hypothetical protein
VSALQLGLALVVLGACAHAAGARNGSTDRCHPRGTHTVLEGRRVSVYRYRTRFGPREWACVKPDGPTHALAYSDSLGRENAFMPPALSVWGYAVGWARSAPTESTDEQDSGRVTDVRAARYYPPGTNALHEGWYTTTAIKADSIPNSRVGSLVVRSSMRLAWIACPPGPKSCVKSGHRATVYTLARDADASDKVASGKNISPRSLRRHGDRIFWTQGGKRRSAPFPP